MLHSRRLALALRVRRLPLGLFGYRRADVRREAKAFDARQRAARRDWRAACAAAAAELDAAERQLAFLEATLALEQARAEAIQERLVRARETAPRGGGGARETDRSARLAALRQQLADIDAAIADVDGRLQALAARVSASVTDGASAGGADTRGPRADGGPGLSADAAKDLVTTWVGRGEFRLSGPNLPRRVQTRDGRVLGRPSAVVLTGAPPRIVGFECVRAGDTVGLVPLDEIRLVSHDVIVVAADFTWGEPAAGAEEADRAGPLPPGAESGQPLDAGPKRRPAAAAGLPVPSAGTSAASTPVAVAAAASGGGATVHVPPRIPLHHRVGSSKRRSASSRPADDAAQGRVRAEADVEATGGRDRADTSPMGAPPTPGGGGLAAGVPQGARPRSEEAVAPEGGDGTGSAAEDADARARDAENAGRTPVSEGASGGASTRPADDAAQGRVRAEADVEATGGRDRADTSPTGAPPTPGDGGLAAGVPQGARPPSEKAVAPEGGDGTGSAAEDADARARDAENAGRTPASEGASGGASTLPPPEWTELLPELAATSEEAWGGAPVPPSPAAAGVPPPASGRELDGSAEAARGPGATVGFEILSFLVGKVAGRELRDANDRLIAERGQRIDADVVGAAEAAGCLPELIVYMELAPR